MKDSRDYKTKICDGIGDKESPKYMLVGMCGGRLGCIQTGIPFTRDGSGKLLIRVLNELGYTKDYEWNESPVYNNVFVTNIVKGVILKEDGNNRVPTYEEIVYWKNTFIDEIILVKPKVIVAIGRIVYNHINTFVTIGGNNPKVLFVRHPSYYLRNGALGKSTEAWNMMVNEYTNVLGPNGGKTIQTES